MDRIRRQAGWGTFNYRNMQSIMLEMVGHTKNKNRRAPVARSGTGDVIEVAVG